MRQTKLNRTGLGLVFGFGFDKWTVGPIAFLGQIQIKFMINLVIKKCHKYLDYFDTKKGAISTLGFRRAKPSQQRFFSDDWFCRWKNLRRVWFCSIDGESKPHVFKRNTCVFNFHIYVFVWLITRFVWISHVCVKRSLAQTQYCSNPCV